MSYDCGKDGEGCSGNKSILTEFNFTRSNHHIDHVLMPPKTAGISAGKSAGKTASDYGVHMFEHKIDVTEESASIQFIPDFDGTVTNFAVNFTATTYYPKAPIYNDTTYNDKLMFSLDIN